MNTARIIPCLLIDDGNLVKTKKFGNPTYLGDPVNAVRIFNEKEADEIIILDIGASIRNREPDYELIAELAGESFMPTAYGGGVNDIKQIKKIIRSGVEKIVINTAALDSVSIITDAAVVFGSQAVIAGVDVFCRSTNDYVVVSKSGSRKESVDLAEHLHALVNAGVGEVFLNCINLDGMMSGYDLNLIRFVASNCDVPLIVCGGAGSLEHLQEAVWQGGASAVAAGSLFVYHGKKRAILINYPTGFQIRRN